MKKKYSRIAEVRARYGNCSTRTVDRGVQRGVIAPPEYLNGIRIWDDELRRQSGPPPTPRSSGGRGRPRKISGGPPAQGNAVNPIASAEQRKTENAEREQEAARS